MAANMRYRIKNFSNIINYNCFINWEFISIHYDANIFINFITELFIKCMWFKRAALYARKTNHKINV